MPEPHDSIGPYRIVGALGRGGMGVVYRGVHRDSGQAVAVKTVNIPREALLQGIRREVRALSRLQHPGIVRIVDEGVEAGLPWYAMELLEGVTLRQHAAGVLRRAGIATPTARTADTTGVTPEPGPANRVWGADSVQTGAEHDAWVSVSSSTIPLRDVLGPLLTLMRRLCAALAYLHGEGIVHRDLKPDNILIVGSGEWAVGSREAQNAAHPIPDSLPPTPSAAHSTAYSLLPTPLPDAAHPTAYSLLPTPFPVLLDFGLVVRFGGALSREALELGGETAGTAAYMAPEQLYGELVDARADLYALGCILYELTTGRPPFVGTNRAQVGWAHLHSEPVPPSELVGALPPELDTLILRLLAKQPRDRIGHANDVASILAGLGAENGLAAAGPRPRAYLYRPGFAGRRNALAALETELDRLHRLSSAGLVLVGGVSGAGKTRLVMEVARRARRMPVPVLAGECQPSSSPEPLGALQPALQAVADQCREHGPAETERLLGRRARVLGAYAPALARLQGQETHPEPPPLPPDAARLRLYTDLTDTLEALAATPRPASSDEQHSGGALLILDDLQWADELTLGWLELLLRSGRLATLKLLLLGTYRTEEVGARLHILLDTAAQRGLSPLLLGRLEETAVGSMVADMLALSPAPEPFVQFLSRQSEGNPFFLAEMLRAAVAEGLLDRDAKGRWQVTAPGAPSGDSHPTPPAGPAVPVQYALSLPSSLRELVSRRLDGLPMEPRRLVEAMAVLGREADLLLAWEVSGLADTELMDALNELSRRQVLETPSPSRARFIHDQIREVALAALPADRLSALHRAAAEAIERRPDADRDEMLGELGGHWESAGVPHRARDCFLAGARKATTRYAHDEAERLFRAVLRLADAGTVETIAARSELAADVLRAKGRLQEALVEAEKALQEARRLEDRAAEGRCLQTLGLLLRDTGTLPEAQAVSERALAIHRESGDGRREAVVLNHLAVVHQEQGRLDLALGLYEQAVALARVAGDRRSQAIHLANLGNVHRMQGRGELAQPIYEEAIALARKLGDPRLEGLPVGNLAILRYEQGRIEEVGALLERAVALHREAGDVRYEAYQLNNLASFHHEQGRVELARQLCERALEVLRCSDYRRVEALCLSHLGWLNFEMGSPAETSIALWDRALELARKQGDRAIEGVTLNRRASLERRRGALEEAELYGRQAEDLLRESGEASDLILCLCERGFLELARGRSARTFLEEAQGLLETLKRGSESLHSKAVGRLRHAIEDHEAGLSLRHGERADDLPEALRRALAAGRD